MAMVSMTSCHHLCSLGYHEANPSAKTANAPGGRRYRQREAYGILRCLLSGHALLPVSGTYPTRLYGWERLASPPICGNRRAEVILPGEDRPLDVSSAKLTAHIGRGVSGEVWAPDGERATQFPRSPFVGNSVNRGTFPNEAAALAFQMT